MVKMPEELEKEYTRRERIIQKGLPFLMAYGATLAAAGEDDRLSWFRELIKYLIAYWYPDAWLVDKDKGEESAQDCLNRFDYMITDARSTGESQPLIDAEKRLLLDTLAMHIKTVQEDDPIPGIVEYMRLQAELRESWNMPEPTTQTGGMTFG